MTIKERLSAVRQIEHANGDTSWGPVDLDTFNEDDQFQVFNTFTGQHEYFGDLVSAKARWDELKQQIIDKYINVKLNNVVPSNIINVEA